MTESECSLFSPILYNRKRAGRDGRVGASVGSTVRVGAARGSVWLVEDTFSIVFFCCVRVFVKNSSTYRYAPRSSSGVQPAESEQCVVWRSARSQRVSVACFPPNIHSQTSHSLGARGLLCPKLKGVSTTFYLPFDTQSKVTHSTNKVTQRLAGHTACRHATHGL